MKTCSKCHAVKPLDDFNNDKSKRDGKCSTCRSCSAARSKAWREENPEQFRAAVRKHYDANRDRISAERMADYYANRDSILVERRAQRQADPERFRAAGRAKYRRNRQAVIQRVREWRKANPERKRAESRLSAQRRVARKRNLPTFTIAAKDVRRLLAGPCAVAGCTATDIQLDHVIPIARGGLHGVSNLQSLCSRHNQSKGARFWIEFRVYLASLDTIAA